MSDLAIALGKRIKSLRLSAGMTQEQVAKKSGLHCTYIGQIERGEKNITVESLGKVLRAIGVNFTELFDCLEDFGDPARSIPRECYEMILRRSREEQEAIHDIIYMVIDMADSSNPKD